MRKLNIQERKKSERLFYSLPVLAVLVALIVLSLWGIIKAGLTKIKVSRELAGIQREITETQAARILLEERSESLGSPEGLEREVRERFSFRKSGEELVVFVDPEPELREEKERPGIFSWKSIKNFLGSIISYF